MTSSTPERGSALPGAGADEPVEDQTIETVGSGAEDADTAYLEDDKLDGTYGDPGPEDGAPGV